MGHLNSRLLSAAFETSFESGDILSIEDSVWTKGRELQDARLTAGVGFTDPKPDTAFGIGFEQDFVAGSPFCHPTLQRLQETFADFMLSPDGRESLRTLMPGFIYGVKPDIKKLTCSRRKLRSEQPEHWLCRISSDLEDETSTFVTYKKPSPKKSTSTHAMARFHNGGQSPMIKENRI